MNNQSSVSNSDISLPNSEDINSAIGKVESFFISLKSLSSKVNAFDIEGLDLNGIENEIDSIKTNINSLLQNDSVIIETYNSLRHVSSLLTELMIDNTTKFVEDIEEKNTSFWSLLGNTLKRTGATIIETDAAIISGVLKVGEHLVDGAAWVTGKVFRYDTSDFIATDLVGGMNDIFYNATPVGIFLDENSYFKHDSKFMKKVQNIATEVTEIAAATAATITTGGASSFALGFVSGLGEAADKYYKDTTKTIDDSTGAILLSGVGHGVEWVAKGELGTKMLNTGSIIGKYYHKIGNTGGTKSVVKLFERGIKDGVRNIASNPLNPVKEIGKGLISPENIAISVGNTAGDIADAVNTGNINTKEVGLKFLTTLGTNCVLDGATSIFGNYASGQFVSGVTKSTLDIMDLDFS